MSSTRRVAVIEGLKAPMLSVIEEHPGIHSMIALRSLQRAGRVAAGVTFGEALAACEALRASGELSGEGARGWTLRGREAEAEL